MATATTLTRVFRLGATNLPDPDPAMNPEEVLQHFQGTFPQLRYGKVNEEGVEGNELIYTLVPNEYAPNG
ncbi:hypothetical protein AWH63_11000 [Marinobacter sp. C18]|uniref:PRTRC system protein C n=1 Tax=Marinobacter sp. C18 TaxID=1772288 RepID=UPI000948F154|nr:PRTRC system protein C [Marinobacter sp. C18]OLF82059.1 hypothetical protein AWH63_11000 [Marinobacter sp. C18]